MALLRKTWRPFLLFLFAAAFFFGAYFFFYPDSYDPPEAVAVPFEQIGMPSSSFSTFTEAPLLRKGVLLVDGAHGNDFSKGEVGALLSRVADRGYAIEFIGETNGFGSFGSLGPAERISLLDEGLRRADSFAVILPEDPYLGEEADIIERYVRKGGKVLLIADPTRDHEINSLSERFGMSFQPDYLWNMVEYDINFQNIFVRNFLTDEVTRGLSQIALYTAGSIKSSGKGLAFTDGNTHSSMVERVEPFYPMVKAGDGQVLAISDLTFMIPPQNAILDNDRLLSNLADYLTDSRREFELADFPHFFKSRIDILLGRADLFDVGTELKSMLSGFQKVSEIRGVEDLTRDTVFLGLYEDSPEVAQYLEVAGVQVDDALRTPFSPDISIRGTAIILLHRTEERHVLVILGESPRALADMVGQLRTGGFRGGLVSELLGVYRGF